MTQAMTQAMNAITLKQPTTPEEFEDYFELRWRILRKPWNEPRGSEIDQDEQSAYHIMALDGKRIAGVALLQFVEPRQAQLRYMAVDEHYQKQGVGRLIVEHMEVYAQSSSAQQLFFHARENAVGFYQKLGYQMIEQSYLLFGCIQHYKMSKKLQNGF